MQISIDLKDLEQVKRRVQIKETRNGDKNLSSQRDYSDNRL